MERTHLRTRDNIFVINEEGYYIAFDPEKGDKWELNDTGALIMRNLVLGASLEEIKDKILEEYDIDPENAEKTLQDFIEFLTKEGIVLEG